MIIDEHFDKLLLIKTTFNFLKNQNPSKQVEINFLTVMWDQLNEMILIAALEYFNTGTTLPRDFPDKLKKLKNELKDNNSIEIDSLINIDHIKALHNIRNTIQHQGRNINEKDFHFYIGLCNKFLEKILSSVFSTMMTEINQINMVTNDKIKEYLNKCKDLLNDQKDIESLCFLRLVYEECMRKIIEIDKIKQRFYLFDFKLDHQRFSSGYSRYTQQRDRDVDILITRVNEITSKLNDMSSELAKSVDNIKNYFEKIAQSNEKQYYLFIGTTYSSNSSDFYEIFNVFEKIFVHYFGDLRVVISHPESINIDIEKIYYYIDFLTDFFRTIEKVYPNLELDKIDKIEIETYQERT